MARAVRADPVRAASVAVLLAIIAMVAFDGGARILTEWARFAVGAVTVTVDLARVDTGPTLVLAAAFAAKLILALAPAVVLLLVTAPRWRIASLMLVGAIVFVSLAFVRACPTPGQWVLAVLASALGVALVYGRRRWLGWAACLPLVVLLLIPAAAHGPPWSREASLLAQCAANDGQRPTNLAPDRVAPFYYGVHVVTPEWVLLMGERSNDGRLLGIPHGGSGSWWLRAQDDGTFRFDRPSDVTGNVWTSCALGDDRWLVRAGQLMRFRPPSDSADEAVERFRFPMVGFDAPDVACDSRRGLVFASDLFDGRPIELATRSGASGDGARPRRRRDPIGARGGAMVMRPHDGRLVALDFQYLHVFDVETSRVLHRTPAAVASQSIALCREDGAVAVPDLAGRLRVFSMKADGSYEFDWGLALFAPRTASFSPDCTHVAVTSADDRHVWIVERASRRVVRSFRVGPGLRGGAFVGPRAFAVADACSMTVLRF